MILDLKHKRPASSENRALDYDGIADALHSRRGLPCRLAPGEVLSILYY